MNKILIIEDEKNTREIFVEALKEEGFNAIGAENGREGIQKIHKHYPNLIICDICMPEVNGYQVLASLRSNSTTTIIPFILMSALSNEVERNKAMEIGANDYLTKPCTVEQLLEAIAKFVNYT